ncbi:D-2-hydroxyacid dehydrogenase [Weissella koreensis]|uniref:D-2-hydroxyacid dehydrogenase n=1 Tax=Weissella koreensis TaxID=165096 RepID=UPI00021753B2|nr:D-2-hydroxyacid dehydrogenase [Weissella koreensis]AEJ23443.1 D-lactate dehydrogenase [Weissella koreensis KACC 15510]EJF33488.1 D-lactate dehydrogenase [Weissella koreensis KCTC 3621]MCZ9310938.1 D-2-hydroxyacid dehydrogenase [Weissella koreensis]
MKIIAFGIREDEQVAVDVWMTKHPEVQVHTTSELLTPQTAKMAEGYDVVNILQAGIPVGEETLSQLHDLGINILTLRNVGTDDLDFDVLKKYQFSVSNVPRYSPNAIAEHAMIQMSRLFRHMKQMDIKVYNHNLAWAPTIGREVRKQTIGIVGTGNIGRVAIQIAQGFGAKVIAYDKFHNPEIEAAGLYVDTLDELFEQADGISLHVPGLPENHHMIDENAIAKMRDKVVIVNAGRGNLVDTDAVISGLDQGKIDGFAMDTYEDEGGLFNVDWTGKEFPDQRVANLITRDNVIVSPHTAFYTWTASEEMVEQSLDAGLAYTQGQVPEQAVKF